MNDTTEPQTSQTLIRASAGTGPGTTYIGTAGIGTTGATEVVAKPWYFMLLVRVARVYLQTFTGLWLAQGTGLIKVKIELSFAQEWGIIATVLAAALAPTFITLIQNATEFFTNLDQTRPGLRA